MFNTPVHGIYLPTGLKAQKPIYKTVAEESHTIWTLDVLTVVLRSQGTLKVLVNFDVHVHCILSPPHGHKQADHWRQI